MEKRFFAALVLLFIIVVLYASETGRASSTAYLNRTTYVYAKPSTSSARVQVTKGTRVTVYASHGSWCYIGKGKNRGYIKKKYLSQKPTVTPRPTARPMPEPTVTLRPTATPCPTATVPPYNPVWKSKVEKVDWFNGGSSVLRRRSYASIYDIDTKITLRIKRKGGTNHADVEPATKADTEKLRKVAGGKFSWASHAVVLICKERYIAAAINTMPHGEQTIRDNGYEGQFCLHLTNSRTHETDRVNEAHQASIDRVYWWAHG